METFTTPSRKINALPAEQAWQMATGQLRAQIDRNTFDAYIRDTRVIDFTGEALIIAAPSAFARDWMTSRLTTTIQRHLEPMFGQPVRVQFVFMEPVDASTETSGPGDSSDSPEPDVSAEGSPAVEPDDDEAAGTSIQESAPATTADHRKDTVTDHRSAQQGISRAEHPEASDQGGAGHPVEQQVRQQTANVSGKTGPSQSPEEDSPEDCDTIILQEVADTVEAALTQPGRIVAFPRYELRHIPLVGPEAFFLRLAFLQERFLNTTPDGRGRPFETTVESLLRWANVGRATLHRFKKGDLSRGQQPAAGWFGIEQLPSAPRSANTQQQPPCRYRLQQGIPLTPMDADRLYDQLIAAGIQADPLAALETLTRRPVQEILLFPPPAPSEEQRKRAPVFTTVAGVVNLAMGGKKLAPELRAKIQEAASQLADHITNPQQIVFVSWYFLRHWLPLLGHDTAALVVFARAQGYYNPQEHELRDSVPVSGGYRELAQVIGLKRDRTIGDWLPNIFDRQERGKAGDTAESEKWQREQQRQQQAQARIGQFIQVIPGSRKKTADGHYAFDLHVEITAEPLTPLDQTLRGWVYRTLSACADAGVLEHFHAWVTSPVIRERALSPDQNDGAGTLGEWASSTDHPIDAFQNDGWGILAARSATPEMTAGESPELDDDGWEILAGILDDGRGILAGSEMTVGELFKGLLRLNTFWEQILKIVKTSSTASERGADQPQSSMVVVNAWDLREICARNGGINRFREQIIAREPSAEPFLSWLCYAYSFKGRGITDPVGWALSRLHEQAGSTAGSAFDRLSALPPARLTRLLQTHLESGVSPMDDDWHFAFHDAPLSRLRQMADALGVNIKELCSL